MKILYLVNHELLQSNGVSKKIKAQKKSLENIGHIVELCYIKKDSNAYFSRVCNDTVIEKLPSNLFGKIKTNLSFRAVGNYILKERYDLVYIRYTHFSCPSFINMLRRLKLNNIQVFMEIPTYPYDNEFDQASIFKRWQIFIDKKFRDKCSKYIDRIVTFSKDELIWGVKTINIFNAVDTNSLTFSPCLTESDSTIRFVMVAYFAYWHGLDRIVDSILEFNEVHSGTEQVELHIIGYGPALDAIKTNASNIIFHGPKSGAELSNLMNKMHVGVDSLGRHRVNVAENNSLKSKEYLYFGLPIIKSHTDSSIDDYDYVLTLKNEDDIFSVEDVIHWFKQLTTDKIDIHNTTKEIFTWEIQMKKVASEVR